MKREPPQTEEGWYVLHDLRRIDWDAWRAAPERERERALVDGIDYLEFYEAVEDSDEGQSAVYTVMGDDADLMILHLRPTMAALDAAERQFEQTEFARFTERASSYVAVTEASGYTEKAREYFEGEVDEDSGLAQYIRSRLHPDIPDDEFVCFYPMNKRREPDQNWYDLPFAERAEHIERHGDIGRQYGGKVTQMIAGSTGLDDWEWGITLWTDDLTHVKDLLTQMRFDPSTSKFAEFGSFSIGRRFPSADLPAVMNGQHVPTADADGSGERNAAAAAGSHDGDGQTAGDHTAESHTGDAHATATSDQVAGDAGPHGGVHTGSAAEGDHPHNGAEEVEADDEPATTESGEERSQASSRDGGQPPGDADTSSGGPPMGGDSSFAEVEDLPQRLGTLGLFEGEEYDVGDYGLVFYSDADAQDLADDVGGLRENFEHYDRHVTTSVRAQSGRSAVVSVWTAKDAAETAAGFLADLPGVDEKYGGHLGEADGGHPPSEGSERDGAGDDIREQLADLDIYGGQPHGEDVFALVLYSQADPEELSAEVADLRESFDHYDTHVKTAVYQDLNSDTTAVVSLWDTRDAADTASGFLSDLPGIVGRPEERDGFGTMGMFYTVKPDHREDFVETFEEVGGMLAEMDGHRETALLANREDENDMFIASQWDAREDAMEFFRSDAFAETVQWGRGILDDKPRHVFLA